MPSREGYLVPCQPAVGAWSPGLLLRGAAVDRVFGSAFLPPGPGKQHGGCSFPPGRGGDEVTSRPLGCVAGQVKGPLAPARADVTLGSHSVPRAASSLGCLPAPLPVSGFVCYVGRAQGGPGVQGDSLLPAL